MSQETLVNESVACTIAAWRVDRQPIPGGPLVACDRCGFDEFVDVPIHEGRSTRCDCARCGLTLGFPIWYGRVSKLEQRPVHTHRCEPLLTPAGDRSCERGPR
jgi:hypothetical protein